MTKLETEVPLTKHICDKKKTQSAELEKHVISLKEIIEKNKELVKEGKMETKIFAQKALETEKKIIKISTQKAKVDSDIKQLELKVEEATLKVHRLKSDLQKRVERNPEKVEKETRDQAIEICQKKINQKDQKLERVEKLTQKANKITETINRETSPVMRRQLALEESKVQKQIIKGEKEIKKLTEEIKKDKKIIRQSTTVLKQIKKEHEKEQLKDLVKGKCTAYTVRPHRRFCINRRPIDKSCVKWSSIYRTEKCLVWKGDECAQKSFKYSKDNSRYECASRSHEYKVSKCVKFDTTGTKCIKKQTLFGIKKCLSYETNNDKLTCVKEKILFPEYACKTKVGSVCTEVVYHRVRFYCQTYNVTKDGHRFCHKLDVFYGEDNFDFECLKEGKHNGKDIGCLEYKKVLAPGAETLKKIGKTWLKEHCKALKKDAIVTSVPTKTTGKVTVTEQNKNAVITTTEAKKDVEAQKIIDQCKKQIKEKLRIVRESNRFNKRSEVVVAKVDNKTKATTEIRNVRTVPVKSLTTEQKDQVKKVEIVELKAIKTESILAKKCDKIIREQTKAAVKSNDPVVFKKAVEEIKKQAAIKRQCNAKVTELSEEGFKKWSVGRVQVESRKQIRVQFNIIESEKEAIFKAKTVIATNEALLKNNKTNTTVNAAACQRKIEMAKTIIAESKKTIAETKKSLVVIENKVVERLGKNEGALITKPLIRQYSTGNKTISNCNKKIVSIATEVAIQKAEIVKATGAKKFELEVSVVEKRQQINELKAKKLTKEANSGLVYFEARKIASSEKKMITLLNKEFKKTVEADKKIGITYTKRVNNDIKISNRHIQEAQITIIKKAPYNIAIREADKIINEKKEVIKTLEVKMTKLTTVTKTPEVLRKIENVQKQITIERKLLNDVREPKKVRVVKHERYLAHKREVLAKVEMTIVQRDLTKRREEEAAKSTLYSKTGNHLIITKSRRVTIIANKVQEEHKIIKKLEADKKYTKNEITTITKKIETLKHQNKTEEVKKLTVVLNEKKVEYKTECKAIKYAKKNEVKLTKKLFKYENPAVVKSQVAVINKDLRNQCHKDIEAIKVCKAKIADIKKMLTVSKMTQEAKLAQEAKIAKCEKLIIRKQHDVNVRKQKIVQNKLIVIKKYQHVRSVHSHRVLTKRELVVITKKRIAHYRRRIAYLDAKRAQYESRLKACTKEYCTRTYTLRIEQVNKKVEQNWARVKRATYYKRQLTLMINELQSIKQVQTYYHKHLTCSKKQNWRAFRTIRRQRLLIIKRATKNIVHLEKSNSKRARRHIRSWRHAVNRQIRAIQADKQKTINVITSCQKLQALKHSKVGNAIIKNKTVTTACREQNINNKAKDIVAQRNHIIDVVDKKIAADTNALKNVSGARKAEIENLIKKYKEIKERQIRDIEEDKVRILDIIKQCDTIQHNTLTVIKKKNGLTCDPIKLRNRVHSLVNTVFLTILRAKNSIRLNEYKLRTE